jgi:hypothetical protein
MVMPILIIAERTLSGVRHEPAQADNSNAAIRIALAISPADFPIDPPERHLDFKMTTIGIDTAAAAADRLFRLRQSPFRNDAVSMP